MAHNRTAFELPAKMREAVERIVRQSSCPQVIAQRAQVILELAQGHGPTMVEQNTGIHRNMVRKWRDRVAAALAQWGDAANQWDDKQTQARLRAALSDAPRSGCPPTFSPEQICQILAIACEQPCESGRPVTHWTPTELADEAVKREIVTSISPRHVGRFLKKKTSSPIGICIG